MKQKNKIWMRTLKKWKVNRGLTKISKKKKKTIMLVLKTWISHVKTEKKMIKLKKRKIEGSLLLVSEMMTKN